MADKSRTTSNHVIYRTSSREQCTSGSKPNLQYCTHHDDVVRFGMGVERKRGRSKANSDLSKNMWRLECFAKGCCRHDSFNVKIRHDMKSAVVNRRHLRKD